MLAALVLAIVAPLAAAPGAHAECFGGPPRANHTVRVGYAFIATVTAASPDVDPPKPENAPFNWHVELDVERVFRGKLPDRLVYNGWDAGCHQFRGDRLTVGDRIFVLTNVYKPDPYRWDPFWTIDSNVLVWQRVDEGWRFYAEVLDGGSDPEFYPPAAREASTTDEIRKLVSAAPLPDTSVVGPTAETDPRWWMGLLVLALSLVIGFVVRLRGRTRTSDRF